MNLNKLRRESLARFDRDCNPLPYDLFIDLGILPNAEAVTRSGKYTTVFVVYRCPFCDGKHVHFAGDSLLIKRHSREVPALCGYGNYYLNISE